MAYGKIERKKFKALMPGEEAMNIGLFDFAKELKKLPKTNDLLERRNEHAIDSFLACLCKKHLASKLFESFVKKKQMLYYRYC